MSALIIYQSYTLKPPSLHRCWLLGIVSSCWLGIKEWMFLPVIIPYLSEKLFTSRGRQFLSHMEPFVSKDFNLCSSNSRKVSIWVISGSSEKLGFLQQRDIALVCSAQSLASHTCALRSAYPVVYDLTEWGRDLNHIGCEQACSWVQGKVKFLERTGYKVTLADTYDASGAIRMQSGSLWPHKLHITLGGQGKGLGLQSSAEPGAKDSMKLERSTQQQLSWIPRIKMASQNYVTTRQLTAEWVDSKVGPEDWKGLKTQKIPWCKDIQARSAPGSMQCGVTWES